MAGVNDRGELTALAKSYATGEIDVATYRADRAAMIDKYCGLETPRKNSKSTDEDSEQQDENSLFFYSLLGAFGVLFFIFLIYLFATTDLALTFQAIQSLWHSGREILFS